MNHVAVASVCLSAQSQELDSLRAQYETVRALLQKVFLLPLTLAGMLMSFPCRASHVHHSASGIRTQHSGHPLRSGHPGGYGARVAQTWSMWKLGCAWP